jgi:translation initiation factor 2-alpha kinase 4
MYDDDLLSLTPEQLVIACRREGILWLVIVKAKTGDDHMLKMKSVLRGSEEESESSLHSYRFRCYD